MTDVPASPRPPGSRVLVVDDERVVRRALQRVLERDGHVVTLAVQARKKALAARPGTARKSRNIVEVWPEKKRSRVSGCDAPPNPCTSGSSSTIIPGGGSSGVAHITTMRRRAIPT